MLEITNVRPLYSENLDTEVSLISNENLRWFVDYVLRKAPSVFWKIPASTSGKFHPSYALGEGGLVRHTKAAVKFANHLLALEMYSHLNKDEILAAIILHDVVKVGFTDDLSAHTVTEHPLLAKELIDKCYGECSYSLDFEVKERITELIASHMGQWNKNKVGEEVLPKPESEAEKFVHMCDYLASRKDLEVIF